MYLHCATFLFLCCVFSHFIRLLGIFTVLHSCTACSSIWSLCTFTVHLHRVLSLIFTIHMSYWLSCVLLISLRCTLQFAALADSPCCGFAVWTVILTFHCAVPCLHFRSRCCFSSHCNSVLVAPHCARSPYVFIRCHSELCSRQALQVSMLRRLASYSARAGRASRLQRSTWPQVASNGPRLMKRRSAQPRQNNG